MIARLPAPLLVALAALAAALAAPSSGPAAPARAPDATLPARLARALAVPHVPVSRSAAVAVDLRTGQVLFSRHPRLGLAPASTEKLAVSYALLTQLGPSYRIRTVVGGTGRFADGTWRGHLVLEGRGDPTLSSADLASLARQVAPSRHPARDRERDRRRVLLRRAAHRAGLEVVVLRQRVRAHLGGARRRRPLPRAPGPEPGARGRRRPTPRAPPRGRHDRRPGARGRRRPDCGARRRVVEAPRRRPAPRQLGQRQHFRRAPAQAPRRGHAGARHDRGRRADRPPRARLRRAFRSEACASWTARVCRGSTG